MSITQRQLLALLLTVALGLVTVESFAAEHTKDSLDAVKKNVADQKAVLVDVREKSEWEEGHLDGAIFVPLSGLKKGEQPKTLAKDRIVYAHCASGKRSLAAADLLIKLGYDVRPLKAGYKDLLDAGFKKAKK